MPTHCNKGHDLAKVGTYRGGRRGWKCRQCSMDYDRALRDRNRRARERARMEAGSDGRPSNQPERTGDAEVALRMFRRAEDAMPWEREEIKARARAVAHGEVAQ